MLHRFIVKMSQAAALAAAVFALAAPAPAHWTDAGNKCVKYDCEGDVMVNTCRFPVQVIYGCGDGKRCRPVGELNTGGVGLGDSRVKIIGKMGADGSWTRDILSPGESKDIKHRNKTESGEPLVGYGCAVPDNGSVYSAGGGQDDINVYCAHTHEDEGREHRYRHDVYDSLPHFQCPAPVALRALRGTPPPGEKLWDPRAREGEHDKAKYNKTHLHIAASRGDYEAARWLIANGADVNATVLGGATPLHRAVKSHEMVALLLENGARINAKGSYNRTPLHVAAWGGHIESVALLLENGADVHVKDNNHDYTPLHFASWGSGETESVVEALLEKGAKINIKTDRGRTPLHMAAWTNGRAIAILLENGADVNAKDDKGRTPLDQAIEEEREGTGNAEAQALLRQRGGRCNTTC